MAETQLVDELPIAFQVHALQVLQQAAALADHFQEAALPMVVLGVRPEVIGQAVDPLGEQRDLDRSEEHTSELQSQSNLVCRLLLEKKKKTQAPQRISMTPSRES